MSPLQLAQQIKHELQRVVWPSGAGALVFGTEGVFVYAGTVADEENHPPGFPFALVTIDSGDPDDVHPELIAQDFTIVLAAEAAGDPIGEHAVIGGARAVADEGTSIGAGVAEIEKPVRRALQNLTGVDGVGALLSASRIGASTTLGRGRHIALAELTLTALCTSQDYFAPVQELAVTDETWSFAGPQCEERFDFVQYRLGFVAGSVPVSDPADATIVATATTAAGLSHTPVAGRAYSVFADYNSRGRSDVTGSSDGARVGAFLTT